MASVKYDHVFKRFGEVVAVNDLNIEIADKEFLVFVGPSGCGKTTSLRLLAGLEEISEGSIYIGDRLVNDVAPKDRDIAMVFQSYALYPHMTVYENMAFGLKLRKTPKAEINRRVKEAAQLLGIEQLLDRKPKQLSGGQRQRVAVGRAIVREPKVFLFDEPLSNLDAKLRVETRDPKTGRRFVYIDIQGGGAGARPTKDGRDGQDSHLARFKNTPIEAVELEYPVRIRRYEFIPDSGGAGKYRGGLTVRRDIEMLMDNITLARYGDRQRFAPFGLFGGKEGSKGWFVLNPDTPEERPLKSKGVDVFKKGDVVSLRLPGAGGYGDPLERDPDLLLADVRDGKVSLEIARRDYSVVIDPETLMIDQAATARLRKGS